MKTQTSEISGKRDKHQLEGDRVMRRALVTGWCVIDSESGEAEVLVWDPAETSIGDTWRACVRVQAASRWANPAGGRWQRANPTPYLPSR